MDKIKKIEEVLNIMDDNNLSISGFEGEFRCPICLGQNITDGHCSDCKYQFSDIFVCPLTDENSIGNDKIRHCVITNQVCPYKGLEYETCEIYHEHGT